MWWLWIVFVAISVLQIALIFWLHLPDNLLQIDPDGLLMSGIVVFIGFSCGSPYFQTIRGRPINWHKAFTTSLLMALIMSSALVSFERFVSESNFRLTFYSLVVMLTVVGSIMTIWFEAISDAILLGAATVPFSVLLFSSMLTVPTLNVAAAMFIFLSLYIYYAYDKNIDLPASLISSYCLSSFLVYGLLASPAALLEEYRAPFFRVIGANDTVLKYTSCGLLSIVWLFKSLIRDDPEGLSSNKHHRIKRQTDNHV